MAGSKLTLGLETIYNVILEHFDTTQVRAIGMNRTKHDAGGCLESSLLAKRTRTMHYGLLPPAECME